MTIAAKYVHANLIAEDWRTLAGFYIDVLGCIVVSPERDLQGAHMDAGTGVRGAHLRDAHLRLPGWGDDGPTLEIFTCNIALPHEPAAVNRPGFGHIAFSVEDVVAVRTSVLQAGGCAVGEVVTVQIATGARVTWCYVTNPEGNIIELQSWATRWAGSCRSDTPRANTVDAVCRAAAAPVSRRNHQSGRMNVSIT